MLNKKCLFCCPYLKKEVKSHFWWRFWPLFFKISKFLANIFTSPTPLPLSPLTNGVGGLICKGLAKTLIPFLQFPCQLINYKAYYWFISDDKLFQKLEFKALYNVFIFFYKFLQYQPTSIVWNYSHLSSISRGIRYTYMISLLFVVVGGVFS